MAGVNMETPNDLMVVFSNTVSAGFAALQGPINGICPSSEVLGQPGCGFSGGLASSGLEI